MTVLFHAVCDLGVACGLTLPPRGQALSAHEKDLTAELQAAIQALMQVRTRRWCITASLTTGWDCKEQGLSKA